MKRFFSKVNLVRIGLLLAASAIILLLVPRADKQSYTYELNQPWKYPLLTADFDTPIMRDSTSLRQLRDSIEDNFVPFAIKDASIAKENVERFQKASKTETTPAESAILTRLLAEVYNKGIVSNDLYQKIHRGNSTKIRVVDSSANDDSGIINTYEGAGLLTSKEAFDYIDSAYAVATGSQRRQMNAEVARSLNVLLTPDIDIDSVNDTKYRNQEYINVNSALGVIKKGQRIVDRGEIINRQIFTNLNTYQEMLNSKQSRDTSHTYFYIGQGLYILICWIMLYIFLGINRTRFFGNIRKMTFLVSLITLFAVVSTLLLEYSPNWIYIMPFAGLPIIVRVFFDSRTALFSLLTAVMLVALIATYQFQFIILELTAGAVATFSITTLTKRSQLLRTAAISLITYYIVYFTLILATDGNLDNFAPRMLLIFLFNAIILSFAYVFIFLIERIFGFTSMVTLVELSDINNPLLRRLAEEAPGTFQHSMQVSTLAAEAARAIGADTQLTRTGALYHDIGKLESPVFFTENQHGVNPHAGLNPVTSAHKIISHVTYGLTLAAKAKLPQVIRDFIAQHHGKGITKYFYNTAVNESNGKPVDRSQFQYPGPNPQTRETAILMMADSVEAASRSLKDFSQQSIDSLVDKIIDSQIADGLLRESPLSFRDVETIRATFKKRLATIYHARIAYPEIKKS